MSYPKWQRITSQADGLGESPFWHPAEKCLYWVDIPGQRLRRMAMTADALGE
ncbi:MAG: L-arabinolactonase, partial [Pseudomonadota bacterium]